MQTQLADFIRDTPAGAEAARVLRACVHCGFCNATCPTYQLRGDELDGPRGRIYLIKEVLEGKTPGASTRLHLDRCLTCRACETTCPSGVEYHALLDIGRAAVETQAPRPLLSRLVRRLLAALLSRPRLFTPLARLGHALRALLPASLRRQLSGAVAIAAPRADLPRRMLVLGGCVQPGLAPGINAAAARVLARAGVALIEAPRAGCCGALRQHLGDVAGAQADMRRLIDAWWPQIEAGAEAIVSTASGCGAQLADYARLLRDDPAYAGKAARVAELHRDLAEVVDAERERLLPRMEQRPATRIAFQAPCTQQHGLRVRGSAEALLRAAGYELAPVADAHLCCGSAGTYSIFQPALSRQLRAAKLSTLEAGRPRLIATANIGCQTHLAAGTTTPVRHWIELFEERLGP
jgi:glycolate oxidase iron-sulfur subunit